MSVPVASIARGGLAILLVLGAAPPAAAPAHVPGVPGWQQRVRYRFAIALDPRRHEIAGAETLTYWNASPDTLRELYFHLYLNGYRPGSNLARREARFGDYALSRLPLSRSGEERIEEAVLADGDTLRFEVDDTVARVGLPRALLPGDSIELFLRFRSVLPETPARMGRKGRSYYAGQWFPKICVYDRFGWHKEQHVGSEFYSDFGVYDLRITLPGTYVLAHTGVLLNPEEVLPDSVRARLAAPGESAVTIWDRSAWKPPADSTARRALEAPKTWVVHADSVHDFAWAADERFIWRRARWGDVEVCTYHRAADARRWGEMAGEGARILKALSTRFGPYPFPRFSIVEEPIDAGGVEYPHITFVSPRYGRDATRRLEEVIAHEMAHNWFYGMVGSNETEQAFLDEGFTSFATAVVMETLYGREGNQSRVPRSRWWLYPPDDTRTSEWRNYLEYQARDIEEPILTHSDRFRDPSAYYPSVYFKTAVGLWTLRRLAGDERFDAAIRAYFARWRFHHPYAEDFFASFEESAGASYGWFFDGWFRRTDAVDLALTSMRAAPLDRSGAGGRGASSRDAADSFRVEVEVESRGGIDPPVTLELRGAGRAVRREVPRDAFVGAAGRATYRTTLPFRPRGVLLDPDLAIPDLARFDNRIPRRPDLRWQVENFRLNPMPLSGTRVAARPDLWYQGEAGPQVGAAFDATTVRWQKGLRGLTGIGLGDGRLFLDLEGRARSLAFDPRLTGHARAYGIDGHAGYAARVEAELSRLWTYGAHYRLHAGVDGDRLLRPENVRRPEEWSEGGHANVELGAGFKRSSRFAEWNATMRLRSALLTERASYGSAYLEATARTGLLPRVPLAIRVAAARVRGGRIPVEERFQLSGAGPRGEMASRWFRSRGSLPTHWAAALGGDGNVRAFADRRPSGTTLVAINVESRFGRLLPAWPGALRALRVPVLNPTSSLFLDVGKVDEEPGRIVRDLALGAGFGVRTRPLFWRQVIFRCDVPVYRTPRLPGEPAWKLRPVISVGEAF